MPTESEGPAGAHLGAPHGERLNVAMTEALERAKTAPRSSVLPYDELRLRFESTGSGTYRVIASGPTGEVTIAFSMPLSDLEVENFILRVSRARGRRRVEAPAIQAAKEFGGRLFGALFQAQLANLYHGALARAQGQGRGLRLTLNLSNAPELMEVPWEYLYDAPDFLTTSAFTPVVRYLDVHRPYRALRIEPPLRILGVVASPQDYERLDVAKERENLTTALGDLIGSGAVEVDWLEQPSLGALLRNLQARPFHILHFVGHGGFEQQSDEGVLLFADEHNRGHRVSGDKLATVLRDFSSLRLAVLNACEGARTAREDPFAGVAASLVQRGIPAVIAMQFEITDEAAIVFAEAFYRALASGHPVDAALGAARLAIFAEYSDDIEWGTPVLFLRVGDGRIFNVPDRSDAPPVPAGAHAPPAAAHPLTGAAAAQGGPSAHAATVRVNGESGLRRGMRGNPRAIAGIGVLLLAVIVVVLVLTLGGGGGGVSPGDLHTQQGQQVASAIDTFYNALSNDNSSTACAQLAPAEAQRFTTFLASTNCSDAVSNIYPVLAGKAKADVVSVDLHGDTATATLQDSKGTSTAEMINSSGRWLIAGGTWLGAP